jgi:hypothetical protein
MNIITKTIISICILFNLSTYSEESGTDTSSLQKSLKIDNQITPQPTSFDLKTIGKFTGTIGSYAEYTNYSLGGDQKDFDWGTGYIKLKFESAQWNKLRLGVEWVGHVPLAYSGAYGKDKYNKDIERRNDFSELYLEYAPTTLTKITLGRINHQKFTHLDDAQSEGIFFQSKEIKNLEIVIGTITKFAEIDYDDMEKFGQEDGKQDLSNDAYYGDSDDYLFFTELTYQYSFAKFNPYLYYQGGYATVYGMDTTFEEQINEKVKLGLNIYAYGVDIDSGSQSKYKNNKGGYGYNLEPFVKISNWKFSIGFAGLDGSSDEAINKPAWFKDYLTGFDQDTGYFAQDVDIIYAKIYWESNQWKSHILFGHYSYRNPKQYSQESQSEELELQTTYQFTDSIDLNARYFYVNFTEDEFNQDYQKIETRLRYKF